MPEYSRPGSGASGGPSLVYGDGSDGAVTISTTVSLSRDMFYTTLVIASGGILQPNGFRVFASQSIIVQAGGSIARAGSAGASNVPGSCSDNNNQATVGQPGVWTGANGNATGAGTATAAAGSCLGGSGGNGGTGAGGAGGAGGIATGPAGTAGSSTWRQLVNAIMGAVEYTTNGTTTVKALVGGIGGASGGGDGVHSGAAGGGGGAGGVIVVVSPNISNSGSITAAGGRGGDGNGGFNTGGGGGGGGGFIITISNVYTGVLPTVAGGAAGNASGTGTNGTAGGNGTLLQLTGPTS